jgi:uncharacterized protein YdeI (YjbR/CyaY-like superfamily)
MEPRFFTTPAELRDWFAENHWSEPELWVGFHKRGSGRPSITWSEAVDEALCVGWIDGLTKRVDETSYRIRFTPRKARSTWSLRNVKRVAELTEEGRMQPAGTDAFERRTDDNTGVYSFEQETVELAPEYERELKANAKAWEFFSSKPPSYRKPAIRWVMSAKREDTRLRRLGTLIEDSEQGRTIKPLTRPGA